MFKPASRPATYADIEALPPHVTGEILFGNLYAMPRPQPRHSAAANRLGFKLTGPFDVGTDGPGGWVFMMEPELHLGPHVVVPDLAGWRRTRMPYMPQTAAIELTPDWVCEILSPSTVALDRGPKRRMYATQQLPHYWLLDPLEKVLEVFALRDGQWLLLETFEDNAMVTAAPFDAVPFPFSALWALDEPPRSTT